MKSLSILVIEDEPLYAGKIEMQLDMLGYEHLGTVNNSQDALEKLEEVQPDLVLMDINIRGYYDGIELAQMIRDKYDIPALFISSLKDDFTFKRALRVKPIGFLIKPFDELQLKRTLEVFFEQNLVSETSSKNNDVSSDTLLIKKGGKLVKIQHSDLLYLKADKKYTYIYTEKGRFHIRKSMINVVEDFSNLNLLQCHRSYIVNASAISEIDLNDHVVIIGEHSVPLSLRNKDEFLSKWQQL